MNEINQIIASEGIMLYLLTKNKSQLDIEDLNFLVENSSVLLEYALLKPMHISCADLKLYMSTFNCVSESILWSDFHKSYVINVITLLKTNTFNLEKINDHTCC